jgi:pilus assembly protein CpaE
MTHSVIIAAPDQTTGYELRAQVDELADFTVVDVADSTQRLVDLVAQRDPEIVLIHDQLGPTPVLQTIRDMVARRPGTAILLLNEVLSPEVFSAAMDAGARGVLAHPVTHEALDSRLTASAEWVTQMRKHLSAEVLDSELSGRGRLVAIAGSKGGVGTTTIAVHLAHDAVTRVAGRSVCVVDLNLDNGDLADVLGITHRLDISDLAKVADDLSAQTIGSAIHRSLSGLSALLGPSRIEDIGEVGERETVLILAALRRQFDLVIVDCGASVTPASAAAVESADEVLLVCTPDLLALRGTHRTTERWRRIGARNPENVKIVLNQVSRDSDIQPDTAARLLPTAPIDAYLPSAFKTLQRGLNHQDPAEIRARAWWSRIETLAAEVGTVPAAAAPARSASKPRFTLFKPRKTGSDAPPAAPVPVDSGQATIEFAGTIALVIFLMVLLWQVALWGVSAAYTSHAADEAAREAGLTTSSAADIREAAIDAVPKWFRTEMDVNKTSAGTVKVSGSLPVLLPSVAIDGLEFTSEVDIVPEDGS